MLQFQFITQDIAIGGGPASDSDIEALINAGLTYIVDVRQLNDSTLALGADRSEISVCYNPTNDDGQTKPPAWFDTSYQFVKAALAAGHKVYIHCDAGVNRGPSTAYFVMRALYGLFGDDVKCIIHTHRPETVNGIRYANDADTALQVLGYL